MRQCSLAVEHPLSKREVVGSNPAIGSFIRIWRGSSTAVDSIGICLAKDTVSEWLRRWTRNPLGSARRGSNPLGVDFILTLSSPWFNTRPGWACDSEALLAQWLERAAVNRKVTGSIPVGSVFHHVFHLRFSREFSHSVSSSW